jgi:hypothetical protein
MIFIYEHFPEDLLRILWSVDGELLIKNLRILCICGATAWTPATRTPETAGTPETAETKATAGTQAIAVTPAKVGTLTVGTTAKEVFKQYI